MQKPLARRARELATNAWITASTVAHHVTDDPVVFCLQVSRRLRPACSTYRCGAVPFTRRQLASRTRDRSAHPG